MTPMPPRKWCNRLFTDRELEARSSAIELHGSIAGLTPDQAPAAVLPTCGLSHRLQGGVLRIDSR